MTALRLVSAVTVMHLLVFCPVMAEGLQKGKDIEFKSSYDQTTQKYILRLPSDFNDQKQHDLLIVLHGHGSDRKQFAESDRPQCVATRDIAENYDMIFAAPDYRAKTSWMGPAAEADVVQIIGELKAKNKIGRVFICGGSMGGSSALSFAVMHPEMIAGVAAMNPTVNHLEYTMFQDAISQSFGGTKKEIPAEYKKRSAEYWPEKVTFPVGITVGDKDKLVPPQSARRFADVLEKIGKDALLIDRPEMGHDTNYEDTVKILEYVIENAR